MFPNMKCVYESLKPFVCMPDTFVEFSIEVIDLFRLATSIHLIYV